MASRSLGTLTLDLVARVGGYTQGLSQAERETDKRAKAMQKRAKEVQDQWEGVGRVIAAGFAGITIGSLFSKFIQESKEAQDEQAQLAAAIRSTGGAAGYTADQLNQMAQSLAGNSTFGDGDINKAQTRLLAYTNVVGKQFPQALQAAIDMATRLNMPIEQSAEAIGKALDVPSQGLAALSKQGFRFSEDQKKVIERLEQTGKTAQAQQIILDQLNSAYGGAAKAARETFGGSIKALQEQLNSLMTGDDGSLNGVASSINDLTRTLDSPQVKQAFGNLVTALATVIEYLASATTWVVNFAQFAGEALARLSVGSADPLERLDERLVGLRVEAKALNDELGRERKFSAGNGYDDIKDLQDRLKSINREIENLQKTRATLVREANNPTKPIVPELKLPTPGKVGGGSGKDPYAEAQRYLESLQKQLVKVSELTMAEQVLLEIQSGRLGQVNAKQKEQILFTAQQIDTLKELNKAMDEQAKADEERIKRMSRESQERQQRLDSLLSQGPAARLEKDRDDIAFLTKSLEEQRITEDQYLDAVTGRLGLVADETKKNASLAEELGLTFTSAFEDAIAGGKGLSDVLKGLESDILRIVTRKLVTEPLGNTISDFAKGIVGGGGSGFSGIFSGIGEWFKSAFSFDGGGYTGTGSRSGGLDGKGGFMAMLHPNETVLDHTRGQTGATYNITVPVQGNVDTQTREQIAATVALQLNRADLRNN